ncbi:MAG: cupin domain-containing protein [Candidatus Omnitrophota bacterium]
MLIRELKDCDEITALDACRLRELLHPDKQDVDIRYSLAHARVAPFASTLAHKLKNSEVYYIVKGEGVVYINGVSSKVFPGSAVYIPPGAQQYIANTQDTELEFLCIVDPAWHADEEQKC